MNSRLKMYVIHIVVFVAIFIVVQFISRPFFHDLALWPVIIAASSAWILAPKPHVEETQSGNQYGLRFLFSKKIIKM